MHSGAALPLCETGTPMTDALLTISQKGFGVIGVVSGDGTLAGIITDGDLRRHMQGLLENDAGAVMTRNPTTIAPGAMAEEAVQIMNRHKITCLFVLEDARPTGLLHIHDCLRAGLG
jgi:arabinose-5-phosphate isomerase